jgi:glycosyltransferase involved in cell wall biosynthesis
MNNVSVVVTCHNQGRFLAEAIESVLSQAYQPSEIIVVDDGSTDETAEVSRRYPRVRYVFQPNLGLAAARNRGIQEGRGDFFVFLDADDRLLPPALESGMEALLEHPECVFAFGDYRVIESDGAVLLEPPRRPMNGECYSALLRGNCIEMHATVIYRRSLFDEIGTFNISL